MDAACPRGSSPTPGVGGSRGPQASHAAHEPLLWERLGVSRCRFPHRRLQRAGIELMTLGPVMAQTPFHVSAYFYLRRLRNDRMRYKPLCPHLTEEAERGHVTCPRFCSR